MEDRRRRTNQTILPLRSTSRQLSATVSCWYCDFKFSSLNEPLFRFGRKHSKYLRVWFSVGIGFSLAALFGVTLIILFELAHTSYSVSELSYLITGLSISLPNIVHVFVSSVVCIFVHEIGHALAAASEGVHMEYVAVFLAVLFPGALVAFNHASLQSLPGAASLRVYCAGIWHNAAFCAVCTLGLFVLPSVLSPFYVYGENPVVLDVPSVSPLSEYLSPHDVIHSLDDVSVLTAQEWKHTIDFLSKQETRKGYCVPRSLIEESPRGSFQGSQTQCPNDLSAFAYIPCPEDVRSNYTEGGNKENYHHQRTESVHCWDAKDVIKLKKCGQPPRSGHCVCSEVESCLAPVQLPDMGWIEITYSSLECRRGLVSHHNDSNAGESICLQTFVFVGDLSSMAHSIRLTSYQPRWSIVFGAHLPDLLEKFLTCAFHVSVALSLLNSMPVFFLDGQCILEVILQHHISSLSPRKKRLVLRCCLLLGTFISMTFMLKIFFVAVS